LDGIAEGERRERAGEARRGHQVEQAPVQRCITIAFQGFEPGRRCRIDGHVEGIERQRQAGAMRLHERLLARPAAIERLQVVLAREGRERRTFAPGEEMSGDILLERFDRFDIDADGIVVGNGKHCHVGGMAEIEVEHLGRPGKARLSEDVVGQADAVWRDAKVVSKHEAQAGAAGDEVLAMLGIDETPRARPFLAVQQWKQAIDVARARIEVPAPDIDDVGADPDQARSHKRGSPSTRDAGCACVWQSRS